MPLYFFGSTPTGVMPHSQNTMPANCLRSIQPQRWAQQPDQFKRTSSLRFGHNAELVAEAQPSPLLTAVQKKDLQKAQLLLQNSNLDPNQTDDNGNTLLNVAARNVDVPMAELLLAHGAGASVNQPGTQYGDTPLYWATVMNHIPMVQLLLAHGAGQTINNADIANGRYPLFYSVNHNNLNMTRLLLENGASLALNTDNMNLQTPLYLAVNHNNPQLVELLLQHGAASTIDRFNPDGHTALSAAIQNQNPEIAYMLLAYGAFPQLIPQYFKPNLKDFLVNRLNQAVQCLPHAPDTTPRLQVLHQLNKCRQVLRVYNAVWPNNPAGTFPQENLDHIAETAGAVGYLEAAVEAHRTGAHEAVAGRSFASQILGMLLPEGTSAATVR